MRDRRVLADRIASGLRRIDRLAKRSAIRKRRLAFARLGLALVAFLAGCNALLEREVSLVPEPCPMPLPPCGATSLPVTADWDGDGRDSPALFDAGRWCVTNLRAAGPICLDFRWGTAGDTPIAGDWNGDRIASPGWFRGARWSLKDASSKGDPADFNWGPTEGLQPLAGDWDVHHRDTPGGARDLDGSITWTLSNHNSGGGVDHTFSWGVPGAIRLVGDWDGDGTDTPAWFRRGVWTFSLINRGGPEAASFRWGTLDDLPLAGDWDGDGVDTIGLYRAGTWSLTDTHVDALDQSTGPTDYVTFRWGTE